MPEFNLKKEIFNEGVKILDLLYENKIFLSKSDARRAIKSNGLRINNIVLKDENKLVQPNDFKDKILKFLLEKEAFYN